MNKKVLVGLLVILVVIVGGYLFYANRVSNDKEAVKTFVEHNGEDKIEVRSVEKVKGGYRVEGDIVKISNEAGSPDIAARRPVTLVVTKKDNNWFISSVTLGAYPGDGEWIYSLPTPPLGTQFLYPKTLPTTYISSVEWPPEISLAGGDFSCAEQDKHVVGDRIYCVTETSDGAAGSTYKTFEYMTAQGDFLAHVKFTLRFPQCANYNEPEQGVCKSEQTSFDIDGLVDRITSSIRMH